MSARRSSSMNWNWWPGNKIAPVWKRPFKKRSIVLRLNRPEWSVKWKLNSKMNLNYKSRLPNRTHNVTFKASRGVFILKTRHSLKRQWVKGICLTFTNVRRPRCCRHRRSKREELHFSRMQLKSMKREGWHSKRRSKYSKKRFSSLKNHFNR